MQHEDDTDLEALNEALNDPELLRAYKEPYDSYQTAAIPGFFGRTLVWWGNLVYGKAPSYLKFRGLELVARVPYHSWESAAYTLLTLGFSSERRALKLTRISNFARVAQDNETMHVVVISYLTRSEKCGGPLRRTILPMIFAFFYFWVLYFLYLANRRWALELNYLFENHAFHQYDEFIRDNEQMLRHKVVGSDFLLWYGRHPHNQYEFFRSVRNDELIHRNSSIHEIAAQRAI